MSESDRQWYTNKDLFEFFGHLKDDFQGLRDEMKETRQIIKQYNGLREEVGEARKELNVVKEEIETLQAKAAGRSSVWNDIRLWGSWLITLGALIFAAIQALK